MRWLITLFLLFAAIGTASAHEIAGDAGILHQLGHALVGWHHLPVTVVLIVVVAALYRAHKRAYKSKA